MGEQFVTHVRFAKIILKLQKDKRACESQSGRTGYDASKVDIIF